MRLAARIFLRRRLSVTLHSRRLHASQGLSAFQQHSSAVSKCHNTKLRESRGDLQCALSARMNKGSADTYYMQFILRS